MTDTRWKHPFTAILAGPSGCGKTYFVKRFLTCLPSMVSVTFKNIVWCFGEWQPVYDTIQGYVSFQEGLPDIQQFNADSGPHLLIIDDQMREADSRIVDLFTKGSHHRNLSIMFITQNLFHQGKGCRDISLNTHYIVCFKNPRDKGQIYHLCRQVCPENSLFLREAYQDATTPPHGYLVLDLKQDTLDNLRFRTQIFPDDKCNYVYVPTKTVRK